MPLNALFVICRNSLLFLVLYLNYLLIHLYSSFFGTLFIVPMYIPFISFFFQDFFIPCSFQFLLVLFYYLIISILFSFVPLYSSFLFFFLVLSICIQSFYPLTYLMFTSLIVRSVLVSKYTHYIV